MIKKVLDFIKNRPKRLFYKELLVAFVLLSMPFWHLFYMKVPPVQTIETDYFIIKSNYYSDLNTFAWVISQKVFPLIVLITWYFTNRHWWRIVLLIPISFSVLQLYKVISPDQYLDQSEFWAALIFTLPIILFIIWVTRKMNFYDSSVDLSNEIRREVDTIINNINTEKSIKINDLLKNYEAIKRKKTVLNNDDYLKKLVIIRNKIISEIK